MPKIVYENTYLANLTKFCSSNISTFPVYVHVFW